jgi:hypothetical protein
MSRITHHAARLLQSPRRLLILSVVAIVAIQTMLFIQSASIRGFATGDGGVKLWQVQAILHSGNLDAPLNYPGAIYDHDHLYSPYVSPWAFWQNDQVFTEYTSPFIWISVPLFAWFGQAGLLLLPWLCSALIVIVSAWLAWRVRPASRRSAALVPIIVGLASPISIYGLEFWEHTPGTILAVFAIAAIVKSIDARRQSIWLILSGASIGLGLTMRAELYVLPIAIIFGLWLLRSVLPFIRSIFFLAIGGLITGGSWSLYQYLHWGSPFGPRLAQNVPLLGGGNMLTRLSNTTGENWSMLWPRAGEGLNFLTILGVVAIVLLLIAFATKKFRNADFGMRLHSIAIWLLSLTVLALVTITTWRIANWNTVIDQRPDDLLATFPMILLLLPLASSNQRLAASENQGSEISDQRLLITRYLLLVSIAFVLLVLALSPFHGGVQWGPRFLLYIIPPVSVVIVDRLAAVWQSATQSNRVACAIVFAGLLASGIFSTYTGIRFMTDSQIASAKLIEAVEAAPEKVVVTDVWFAPQGAAYTFDDKIWLMAEDDQSMFKLIQLLRKTTNEAGMLYISALTWAHIDPQPLMGPRIAPNGDPQTIDAPIQSFLLSRYFLYK